MSSNFKKVIVGGEMRSGTTFVGNFLNSQQDIVLYSDFLRSPITEGRKLGITDFKKALSEREKNVLVSNLIAESRLMNLPQYNDIARDDFSTWDEFYTLALSLLEPQKQGLKAVGIKITREYHYYSQLLDAGYMIIFLFRDPRDVLMSARNRFGDFNAFEYIRRWRDSIQMAESYVSRTSFMMQNFESLILNPDKEVKNISRFLGVELRSDIETLSQRKDVAYVDNSSFGDVSKVFDKSAVERWKGNPNNDDVKLANAVLSGELEKYGYEVFEMSQQDIQGYQKLYNKYERKQKLKDTGKRILKKYIK